MSLSIGRIGLPRLLTQRTFVRLQSTFSSNPASSEEFERSNERKRDYQPRQPRAPRRRVFNSFSQYFKDPATTKDIPELERTRLVPILPTFYASNPEHEHNIAKLQDVLNKYISLPFKRSNASNEWISMKNYESIGGQNKLTIMQYQKLITVLKRLDSIDSELRTDEIEEILAPFRKPANTGKTTKKKQELDAFGRASAIGRRKSSSAKVWVVEGTGEFLINSKPIEAIFPKLSDRQSLLLPLETVASENAYNVFAVVRGGGSTGQVDSIKLAISRALCVHNPLLKNRLFKAGCLTRDHRHVERKKPGKRKARKMPTWVKR